MNTIPLAPVCIGRLSIDLPRKAVYRWSQSFDNAEVVRLPSLTSAFNLERLVTSRKQQLEQAPHDTEKHLLTEFKKFDDRRYALLFRTAEVDTFTYKIERYFLVGDRAYSLITGIATAEREPLGNLMGSFSDLQPISNFSPSSLHGFCIDGGLVTGDKGYLMAGVSVEAIGFKGISLAVGTAEGDDAPGPDDLPARTADSYLKQEEQGFEAMKGPDESDVESFVVLLNQIRRVDVFEGRAVAFRVKYNNGRYRYRYTWMAQVAAGKPNQPHVSIDLDFDDEGPDDVVQPPSEDQMLALFNAMVDSLKLRPGAL